MLPMNRSHIEPCVDLFINVFANPPWSYTWMRRDSIRAYIEDLFRTPGFRGFIVLRKGKAVTACLGIASRYFAVPTYEIKEILVSQAVQNAGIGSAFLAAIERALMADGIAAVSLYTQKTIPAFHFYEKQGYAPAADMVMMRKGLLP